MTSTRFGWLLQALSVMALAGCGGLSDVGEQEGDDAGPTAAATVINQPSGTDAAGKTTTRVRSGAEVLLTGRDSDGVVAPVLRFEWREASGRIPLIYRNNSTVSFTAPRGPATLQFTLTVTDSNGATDQSQVDVVVEDVPDPNRFLTYTETPLTFSLEATTDEPVSSFMQDVSVDILLKRLVSYTDISGQVREIELGSQSFPGVWLESRGAGSQCGDPRNPRFIAAIPSLDANDIAEWAFNTAEDPAAAPDASKIDSAALTLNFSIAPTGNADLTALQGREPRVCVTNAQRTPVPAEQIIVNDGRQPGAGGALPEFSIGASALGGAASLAGADTDASASDYYATIDTQAVAEQKRTFSGWLAANEFVPAGTSRVLWSEVEAASTAHAVYVNNFDLGLGRDMYARRNCRSAQAPTPGECDVAAVVINYGSLEAAALKTDPIVAVAMEYSALPLGDPARRVVKFYTYAPSEVDGDFVRVNSIDLDGRGQKFMPGACTVCHGGVPKGSVAGVYGDAGDLDAAFLPWDIESLLFSDSSSAGWTADPGDATNSELSARYTKASQQTQLRELNRLAYLTYVDDSLKPGRYQILRDLMHTWYGDALDAATFREGQVPSEWGSDEQQAALYQDVYAQYCRMCHAAQTPNSSSAGDSFEPYRACQTSAPYAGSGGQIAIGCYNQFVNLLGLTDAVRSGRMPNARMTMDRFWLGASGPSAANALAAHLGSIGRLQITDQARPELDLMPTPTAVLDFVEVSGAGSGSTATCSLTASCASNIARGDVIRLLGSESILADEFDWRVERAGSAVDIVGAAGSEPTFVAAGPGPYTISLAVNGSAPLTRTIAVPDWEPVVNDDGQAPSLLLASPNAAPRVLDLLANDLARIKGASATSDLDDGDGGYRITLAGPAEAGTQCSPQSVSGDGFSVSVSCANEVMFSATTTGAKTFNYWLTDIDGDFDEGAVTVTVADALTASDACVDVAPLSQNVSFLNALEQSVSGGVPDYEFSVDPDGLLGSLPGVLTYSTPTGAPDGSAQIYTGTDDTTYSVTDSAGSPPISRSLSFAVKAQAPWSQVSGMWENNGCTGCHTAAAGESSGVDFLDLVTRNGYDELVLGRNPGEVTERIRVDTGAPANSVLLRQVCPNVAEGAPDPCPGVTRNAHANKLSVDDAAKVLRWIQEGGLETENPASCP